MRTLYFLGFFLLALGPAHGLSHPKEQQADVIINQLYNEEKKAPLTTMEARITFFSAQFLEKPYLLGALGEGVTGQYDQSPLYRTDAFDCETYVDTVLALALANDLSSFQQCIRKVRYQNGQVGFISRNHFLSLDWNGNNQTQRFIKDVTWDIKNEAHQPIAQIATALIDKPAWYQHFTKRKIKVDKLTAKEQTARLAVLKQQGHRLKCVYAKIPYLPLTVLFDEQGKPNEQLFHQIPNAAIIEIIRPNWDLKKKIGTRLNASHLGFGIWVNGTLLFRNASSIHGRVTDEPLVDYLRKALKSPTIKGINVQVVLPKNTL